MFKLIFIATSLVALSFGNVDYSDLESLHCRKGPHIGSGFEDESNWDFDSKLCAKWPNVQLVPIESSEQDLIVDEHNKARNETAHGGGVDGVYANRLCKMSWDDSLAQVACFNVWKCYDDHDNCRNTEEYAYVGQNLYNSYSTATVEGPEMLTKAVSKWYAERSKVYSKDVFDTLPRSFNDIGHYTQMMKDNACFVGCCGAKYDKGTHATAQYLVCNYNFGNFVEMPVFERGETASKCETGPHKIYNGLCSSDEVFDISKPIKKNSKGSGGKKLMAHRGGRKDVKKQLKNGKDGYVHTYRTVYRYHH